MVQLSTYRIYTCFKAVSFGVRRSIWTRSRLSGSCFHGSIHRQELKEELMVLRPPHSSHWIKVANNQYSRSKIRRNSLTSSVYGSGENLYVRPERTWTGRLSVNLRISLLEPTLRWSELRKVAENNRLEDEKTWNVTIMFDSSPAQLEELLTFKNEDFIGLSDMLIFLVLINNKCECIPDYFSFSADPYRCYCLSRLLFTWICDLNKHTVELCFCNVSGCWCSSASCTMWCLECVCWAC